MAYPRRAAVRLELDGEGVVARPVLSPATLGTRRAVLAGAILPQPDTQVSEGRDGGWGTRYVVRARPRKGVVHPFSRLAVGDGRGGSVVPTTGPLCFWGGPRPLLSGTGWLLKVTAAAIIASPA